MAGKAAVDWFGLGFLSSFLRWSPAFGNGRALDDYFAKSKILQPRGIGFGGGDHVVCDIRYLEISLEYSFCRLSLSHAF